jgi:hypothetical protein
MENSNIQKKAGVCLGFSVVEVLLAFFVLLIGITSALGVIASSIRESTVNRDIIIASELAQEGVELVRNVRDNNFAKMADNDAGIEAFSYFFPSGGADNNKDCIIDKNFEYGVDSFADNGSEYDCKNNGAGLDYSLGLDNAGYYVHGGATSTKFSRKINISIDPATDARQITTYVWWGDALEPSSNNTADCTLAARCVFTQIILTDWK